MYYSDMHYLTMLTETPAKHLFGFVILDSQVCYYIDVVI